MTEFFIFWGGIMVGLLIAAFFAVGHDMRESEALWVIAEDIERNGSKHMAMTVRDYAEKIDQQAAEIGALRAALALGRTMRLRQAEYFRERTREALLASKAAEGAFDKAAASLGSEDKADG